MDTTQYLDMFIDESNEHLESLYTQLLALEKNPTDKSIIGEIFRSAHTLKGMSATMGFTDLANLTHQLEDVFDAIRYDRVTIKTDTIDVLFAAVDHLNEMVENIVTGGDGKLNVEQVIDLLKKVGNSSYEVPGSKMNMPPQQKTTNSLQTITTVDGFELAILNESTEQGYTTFEITVQLREECLLKGARVFMIFQVLENFGEVIKSVPEVHDLEEENFEYSFTVLFVSKSAKQDIETGIQKVSEVEEVQINVFSLQTDNQGQKEVETIDDKKVDEKSVNRTSTKKSASSKTIRVNIERLDILMNLFEELVIDRGRLEQISSELKHIELQETVERMSRISSDLQNVILTMRMVPIDQVFSRFPRMIRQLARDLSKNVEIEINGAETELDRTVIDEIGDPLVHLIRNAMDHGIEAPSDRKKQGKPEQGTIKLGAYHSGNHIFIEIADDGAGINKEKVLRKAVSNDVVTETEAKSLTEQQIYELIMASGFSTAETVSDLSGRGVGLDVVKNTIESLGGGITIDAKLGKGSTFSIQLPLTLSIMSVLLVELKDEKYAIPLSAITETAIIHKDQIIRANNKKVIDFRGKVVPLVFLKDVFAVPDSDSDDTDDIPVVIVKKGDRMAGIVVDSFIGQQEVVLKSLGDYLPNAFAISGATILGDGRIALIIDSNSFIK